MLEEVTRIATLSRGMFLLNPLQLKDELTSIRQLSPNSSLVKYMSELRGDPNVPVHSIIGDQGQERYAPLLRRRGQVPLLPSGLERQ